MAEDYESKSVRVFIKVSSGSTHVMRASSKDKLEVLQWRILEITNIPVDQQRFIYRGKTLNPKQTLADASVQQDSILHLVSSHTAQAIRAISKNLDGVIEKIHSMSRGEPVYFAHDMQYYLEILFSDLIFGLYPRFVFHMNILYSLVEALVKLYESPFTGNKDFAESSILVLLLFMSKEWRKSVTHKYSCVVSFLCFSFSKDFPENRIYFDCQNTLKGLLEDNHCLNLFKTRTETVREIFPVVKELADKLCKDMVSSIEAITNIRPLVAEVLQDFKIFSRILHDSIQEQVEHCPISLPMVAVPCVYVEEIESFHDICVQLLTNIDKCLFNMENFLPLGGKDSYENFCCYLDILKELNRISKLYEGLEEQFWNLLDRRKISLRALIVLRATQTEDFLWLLDHKDGIDYYYRMCLTTTITPKGLKYLHDHNVIHRDIKCANILVDANGRVKLADFGVAKVIESTIRSSWGTPWWMAPEVINSRIGYGIKADIWSLGCTVLEMLTRRRPYPNLEYQQAMFSIAKGELPHIPDSLTPNSRYFILQCLQVDPKLRPTAAQLLDHPFLE
ncbi:hypothetical protein JCGZ_00293 [Jatropha curcas]|uniref:Protein kinase domain-containing protein n=1 Tax=Jatropha curcas TaxID=180498 RepID=A0A067L1Z0_JATCU|nr:hypothetical protein JCGZ_00293 [Jatropha curcas]